MSERQKLGWLIGLPIAAVVLLWLLSWGWLEADPHRGTFGDMFGSVNALFSGLAFAGVIIAIFLQGQELIVQHAQLKFTQDELKLTRLELERAAKAQEASSTLMA